MHAAQTTILSSEMHAALKKKAPPFPLRAEKEGHLYEDKQGVFLGLAGLAPQAREALMSI